MMYTLSPVQWVKSLRYRSEYLGWFVASILFILLSHILSLIGIAGSNLGLFPLYVIFIFGAINFSSVTAFAYCTTQMFAPVEDLRRFWNTNRRIVIGILAGGLFLIQLGSIIAIWFLGVHQAVLNPLAWPMMILYYLLAVIAGYDSARTQHTKNRLEAIEYTSLFEVLSGKSARKALTAGLGLLLISTIVSFFSSIIAGLSVAGAIAGILDFIARLYPDE